MNIYCWKESHEGIVNVMETSPFLMLGVATFDDHVNALERYWKDDIYTHSQNLNGSLSKIKGH